MARTGCRAIWKGQGVGLYGKDRYSATNSYARHEVEISGQHHALANLPAGGGGPSSLRVGGTVDLRVGRDILEKRKFIAPDGIQTPNSPARS
jgi:hypothetical protein